MMPYLTKTITFALLFVSFLGSATTCGQLHEKLFRAVTLYERLNFDSVILVLSEIPDTLFSEKIRIVLSESYMAVGRFSEARTMYSSCSDQRTPDLKFYLARCEAFQINTTESLEYLKDYMKRGDKMELSYIQQDTIFKQFENEQEWKLFWKTDWYSTTEVAIRDAMYLVSIHDTMEALNLLEKRLEMDRGSPLLFFRLGEMYEWIHEPGNAQKHYESACRQAPYTMKYRERLADYYRKSGKLKKSLEEYTEILKFDEYQLNIYLTRALVFFEMKKLEEVQKDIDFYLTYMTSNAEAYILDGKLALKRGKPDRAVDQFSRAIELNRSDPELFSELGNTYMQLNEYQSASSSYSQSIDLNPSKGEYYFKKALCLLNLESKREACFYLEKAFNLGYSDAMDIMQRECGE